MADRAVLGIRNDDWEKAIKELLSPTDQKLLRDRTEQLAIERNRAAPADVGWPSATHR